MTQGYKLVVVGLTHPAMYIVAQPAIWWPTRF